MAALFPLLSATDYGALVDDIRRYGVKVPILVREGEILDGRHRYWACRDLGVACPMVEWNGRDPWLEVQSRNLLRRHLAKEQIYAIRKLAADRFPELAGDFLALRREAAGRRAQAKGQPRGVKALSRTCDRARESADAIGERLGVSGATVKRVDRLARLAPALLQRVAAGHLSATKGLRLAAVLRGGPGPPSEARFDAAAATERLRQFLRSEWALWPSRERGRFLRALTLELQSLGAEGPQS